MRNTTPNELMMLGTGILMIGLVLGSYSVSTYLEVKDLEKAVDFELIDDNNELSSEEKYYKYIEIDGLRVSFKDSWAYVRASNTGPNITVRFEAKDQERLESIKKEFMDLSKDNLMSVILKKIKLKQCKIVL